jgi:hypothetical protein
VIWVQRGSLPEWYDLAVRANSNDARARADLVSKGIHASETAWVGTAFDQVVDNNNTIEHLYQQLATIVQ